MSVVVLVFGAFVAVALLTGLVRQLALRAQLLDLPVSRSAHTQPTPVGGGLGIVVVYLALAVYFSVADVLAFNECMAVLGGVAIALLGLVDDSLHLDIQWRMPVQLLAAIWSVWWIGDVPPIAFGSWMLPASWLLNTLAVIALLWLLNLYNFMDGIDGLAGSELVYVNAMALVFVINTDDLQLTLLSATLMGGGAGFLLWNWAPAKIFLGDVGSGFIGFSLGVLALISMQHGSMPIWSWVLLLGVFIVDATITLGRRYLQGEKWYEGHSCHAYQNAARKYKSHAKVTICIMMINCFWLAPLAWWSAQAPHLGFYLTVAGLLPLAVLAIRSNAGNAVYIEQAVRST